MKKSIKTHFALLFALLALAPIAIIFAIYSPGVIRGLSNRAVQDVHSLGKSHVRIISLWIKEKTEDAKRLASSHHVLNIFKGLPQDSDGLSDFLHSNLQEHGFSGIYVLDRDGNLKASAERGKHAGLPKEVKQLLEKALKDMHVTLAHFHEPEEVKDKCPMLCLASPVLGGKDIPGAVVVKIDLSRIRDVLMDVTGERRVCTSLIDKEGNMLICFILDPTSECHKSMGKKLVDPRTGNLTPGVKACLSGKKGFSPQVYTNHVGEQVLGAWGWLPDLDTGIIVEVNAREFFGPVSLVKRRLWSFLFIVGVGVIIISIFIGNRVSEPLISLTETAKKIAAGNFEERSLIKSEDELGELAGSLNTMVDSLQKKHTELEEANKKLAATSVRDGLTGLYNHYRFQELMDSEFRRAKRYNLPLCLLMVDIDDFKSINDTYGHPFGDFVLKELAELIDKSVREIDISSRYGGEEFTVILPNTELDGAYAVAEKLRQAAANHSFKHDDMVTKLTLTIGISSLAEEGINTKDDVIKHADAAMYEGKIRGKNVTVSWGEFILWERLASKEERESAEHYRKRFVSTARSVKRSYMETSTALVKTLEAKDGYTATHSYLVTTYAVGLAEELGLAQENIEIIKNSAVLHDIGKIAIPDSILTKNDNLTEEEYNIVKEHPEQSVKILEGIGFLQKELPIILHHQEWFNGKGYPKGLEGTAIPLGARILAICDAYEAMTSKRPYRKSLTHKAALEEIRKGAGVRFDPELVEPFIRAIEKLLATTRRICIPQLNKTVDIS
ncbi:MAG: diguanylate cyclase [Candidatus Brocadiales bacterium]